MDTHVFIWSVLDSPELSKRYRDVFTAPETEIFLSAVSVWEMSIKASLGKLNIPKNTLKTARLAGCQPLDITWRHGEAVKALPHYHKDPFDRLLIAQAQCEGLTLASVDAQIAKYEVPLL